MNNSSNLTHFLLVEDDDDHAYLAKRSLKRSGLVNDLQRVADGQAAMEYLRGEGEFKDRVLPDIVLLDLKLPKKSGLEVLREIRADSNLSHLLVVILTTSTNEEDRLEAYSQHTNSYLVKPIDSEKFQQMIMNLSLYWGILNVPPPRKAGLDNQD